MSVRMDGYSTPANHLHTPHRESNKTSPRQTSITETFRHQRSRGNAATCDAPCLARLCLV